MVGGAGNAPVVTSDVCFSTPVLQTGSRNTSQMVAGVGITPPEEVYEASLCALVEFPAVKWWSRRVTLPHQLACRASALLVCHDPFENWQAALVLPQAG